MVVIIKAFLHKEMQEQFYAYTYFGDFLSHHIISMFVCVCVCVCACVRNERSPEVIRPPGKCHFFLWGMVTVGQREGVQ